MKTYKVFVDGQYITEIIAETDINDRHVVIKLAKQHPKVVDALHEKHLAKEIYYPGPTNLTKSQASQSPRISFITCSNLDMLKKLQEENAPQIQRTFLHRGDTVSASDTKLIDRNRKKCNELGYRILYWADTVPVVTRNLIRPCPDVYNLQFPKENRPTFILPKKKGCVKYFQNLFYRHIGSFFYTRDRTPEIREYEQYKQDTYFIETPASRLEGKLEPIK